MPTEPVVETFNVWAEQPKTLTFKVTTSETNLDFNNGNGYYLVLDVDGVRYNVEPANIEVTATGSAQTVTVKNIPVTGDMNITVIGYDAIPAGA